MADSGMCGLLPAAVPAGDSRLVLEEEVDACWSGRMGVVGAVAPFWGDDRSIATE